MTVDSNSVPRNATSTSTITLDMPPPPRPLSQSKLPSNDLHVNPKRLSWNLPAQSSATSSPRRQSVISISPVPSRSLSPEPVSPEDATQLLTAVAAQERKVLELKEELAKAEADLAKLKAQWAVHEAKKKRNEAVHHVVPMRSLTTPLQDAAPASPSLDSERTRSLLARRQTIHTKAKPPRRFEGGTHARTLSLLSPTSMTAPLPSRESLARPSAADSPTIHTQSLPASAVLKSSKEATTRVDGRKEDVVHTGKSLVGDLKDGLWTFIEDLKQATVGDEAATGARARQAFGAPGTPNIPSRKQSPTTVRKGQSAAARSPKLAVTKGKTDCQSEAKKDSSEQGSVGDDEEWDSWDSPPKTTASETERSTPRTSMSSEGSKAKRLSGFDQIPWPALSKISPSRLSKTASSLMQEWENSIKEPAAS